MSATIVACTNCGRRNRVPAAAAGVPRCSNCGSPLPWIATATDSDFQDVVGESDLPVLVDFWADWCGPCRMVSPALENLAREYAGRVKLVKVDVEQSTGLATRFEIRGIPTLLVMDHGELVSRQTGAAPEPTLRAWLDEALSNHASA